MKIAKQQRQEQAETLEHRVNPQRPIEELTSRQLVELLGSEDSDIAFVASKALITREKEALEALIEGLSHASGKVRAGSALLMDHLADDRCVEPLRHAMRHDPLEAVRRCAMHSLVCDGCKECPLTTDVVEALIQAALTDRSLQVRRRAVFYLEQQRPDERALQALEWVLNTETDPILLRRTRRALASHQ